MAEPIESTQETQEIDVEVAYALPDKQAIVKLTVPAGTTAAEAVTRSAIAERFDGVNLDDAKLGIFAKVIAPSQVLAASDRVEVYRPLIADPKEVRKARAARAKERRSAG